MISGRPVGRKVTTCPGCGVEHDALAIINTDEPGQPEPGDVSLCIHCGEPSVFDDNLNLREPTKAERDHLFSHPALVDAVLEIKTLNGLL